MWAECLTRINDSFLLLSNLKSFTITSLVLQVGKFKLGEVKSLTQSHPAHEWCSWDSEAFGLWSPALNPFLSVKGPGLCVACLVPVRYIKKRKGWDRPGNLRKKSRSWARHSDTAPTCPQGAHSSLYSGSETPPCTRPDIAGTQVWMPARQLWGVRAKSAQDPPSGSKGQRLTICTAPPWLIPVRGSLWRWFQATYPLCAHSLWVYASWGLSKVESMEERRREGICQKVIACSRPMIVLSFLSQPRNAEISSKGLDPSSLLLLSPQFPSPPEMQATFS